MLDKMPVQRILDKLKSPEERLRASEEFALLVKNTESDKLFSGQSEQHFELHKSDQFFFTELKSRFLNKEHNWTIKDLEWITARFIQRWQAIKDTYYDYTFDSTGLNAFWVGVAKTIQNLASDEIHYLELLLPIPKNFIDWETTAKLQNLPDARALYLNDNGTFNRVLGIYNRYQGKTFDIPSNYSSNFFNYDTTQDSIVRRGFTLTELFRLRAKRGEGVRFSVGIKNYKNLWEYIRQEVAPFWQKSGSCPTKVLPTLLVLIEHFLPLGNKNPLLPDIVALFIKELATCSIEDINYFYGFDIKVGSSSYYLVDILLEMMDVARDFLEQPKPRDLYIKLIAVVSWLSEYDPSLISKSAELQFLYKEKNIGSYLNYPHLEQLVKELEVLKKYDYRRDWGILLQNIKSQRNKPCIEKSTITLIKKLYSERWATIIDSALDYTCNQQGENSSWIRLARILAGAEYIENYYKLLIPTITMKINANDTLNNFIVTENEQNLIYLPTCLQRYKIRGTLSNGNTPLTLKEIMRLNRAMPLLKQEEEMRRRVVIIIVSLFTYPFECSPSAENAVRSWDRRCFVPPVAKEIFEAVKTHHEINNFLEIHSFYNDVLINKIVRPALENKALSPNVSRWLETIKDESMFLENNHDCFTPTLLFFIISKSMQTEIYKAYNNSQKALIRDFLDEVIQTFVQPDIDGFLKSLRINISFSKLITENRLGRLRDELLNKPLPTEEEVIKEEKRYLIERLKSLDSSDSQGLAAPTSSRAEKKNSLNDHSFFYKSLNDIHCKRFSDVINGVKKEVDQGLKDNPTQLFFHKSKKYLEQLTLTPLAICPAQ